MENTENSEPLEGSEFEGAQNGNGASGIAAKAEEKARELRDAARAEAGNRVQALGQKAQERIDSQRDRVATQIEGAATRLRERGEAAGPIGRAAGGQVAGRMEAAAGYLHQRQTDEIAGDVSTNVKQHPIQSIAAAAVLGYLLGRLSG